MADFFDVGVFLACLTTLVVIQDPLGAVPIFLSLTGRQTQDQRHASARQATIVSAAVIFTFAVFGRYILLFLDISVPALQLSGGLLLLLVAMELLTDNAEESPDPDSSQTNLALVPLGTPLLAGPGAIVAVMVSVEKSGGTLASWSAVVAAIIVSHLLVWITLRFSSTLNRLLGASMIQVLTRVAGLLLAAIATQMMANAVFAFIEARG